jgi:feruloyl esterase
MYYYKKECVFPGLEISRDKFQLPVGGAVVKQVEFVPEGAGMFSSGDFYRITGTIYPSDHSVYDIHFQIGFPVQWNGKLLQICGGGLDGTVTPVEFPAPGSFFGMPSVLAMGYAVCSSDGGHIQPQDDPFNCEWGLNDEAMENYAYKAIKRTHDLAYELAGLAYKMSPQYVYIAGGSNGGRECLKALEHYAEDYDGAICLYPVQSFIAKVLFDNHYGTVLGKLGQEAVISAEDWERLHKKILAFSDGEDGVEDRIISNLSYAREHREDVREMLAEELNAKQLAFLDTLSTPLKLPFDLGYGTSIMNEIPVYEGTSIYEMINGMTMVTFYGSEPAARDTMSVAGADGIMRNMIMRDPDFDVLNPDYNRMKEQLCRASALFDVTPHSLDRFRAKGGKVILAQGTADPLVPVYATIQFYERLLEQCGESLHEMLRFYLIPGYGHGFGGTYGMHVDFVSALDTWVTKETAPSELVSLDCMDSVNHRTRPVYEYPYYPVYNGKGDVNKAESFHPEKLGDLHIAR